MNTLFRTCVIVSSPVQTNVKGIVYTLVWVGWLLVKNIYPIFKAIVQ